MASSYTIADRIVTMPCEVRDASAGTAMFDVDAGVAAGLVPDAFEVVEASPGRCQLIVAVIDYRDNDLGDYLEVGLTLFVTPKGAGADAAGTFITHLPVDQSFTCEAGRTIWGFPKSLADIGLDRAGDGGTATATLRMDGELVLRLTLPCDGHDDLPSMAMTTYTVIDGAPHATRFTQGGTGALVGDGSGVRVELGPHPVGRTLAALGLPGTAAMSTWTERMHGTFEEPQPLA